MKHFFSMSKIPSFEIDLAPIPEYSSSENRIIIQEGEMVVCKQRFSEAESTVRVLPLPQGCISKNLNQYPPNPYI